MCIAVAVSLLLWEISSYRPIKRTHHCQPSDSFPFQMQHLPAGIFQRQFPYNTWADTSAREDAFLHRVRGRIYIAELSQEAHEISTSQISKFVWVWYALVSVVLCDNFIKMLVCVAGWSFLVSVFLSELMDVWAFSFMIVFVFLYSSWWFVIIFALFWICMCLGIALLVYRAQVACLSFLQSTQSAVLCKKHMKRIWFCFG